MVVSFCLTLVSSQLGLCPEASTHLEQMKNMLIAISNELLDDDTDLSPDRIQELRQERFISQSFFFLFSWLLKFSVLWRLWYITQQNLLGIMQQKEIRLKEVIDNASVS